MLKGHVFSNQIFGNPIFALFINTFLNGANGISDNYKNGMALSHSGASVTIDSGAVCIQGRFLEENLSTTLSAGTDAAYCKLVIEIDLDKTNTAADFQQGSYKIIKGQNDYPSLTQTNIVKNNAGVYQYELARFKTGTNGITDFQDMRTFLDFDSIYDVIEQHIQDIDDGSIFIPKSNINVIEGTMQLDANTNENLEQNKLTTTSKTIEYPNGYDKSNCVVIAFGTVRDSYYNNRGYAFNDLSPSGVMSLAMLTGAQPKNVSLMADGIHIWIGNLTTERVTYKYKLVLMKIS